MGGPGLCFFAGGKKHLCPAVPILFGFLRCNLEPSPYGLNEARRLVEWQGARKRLYLNLFGLCPLRNNRSSTETAQKEQLDIGL